MKCVYKINILMHKVEYEFNEGPIDVMLKYIKQVSYIYSTEDAYHEIDMDFHRVVINKKYTVMEVHIRLME